MEVGEISKNSSTRSQRVSLYIVSCYGVHLLTSIQLGKRLLGTYSPKSRRRSKNSTKAGKGSASYFPSTVHRFVPDPPDRPLVRSPHGVLTLVPMVLKAKRSPPRLRSPPILIQTPTLPSQAQYLLPLL